MSENAVKKKYKFKVKHTYITEHIWEDTDTISALENFDRALSDGDLNFGEKLEKDYESDEMPEPICNSCGNPPSWGFRIPCCQSPDFPHTEEDLENLESDW